MYHAGDFVRIHLRNYDEDKAISAGFGSMRRIKELDKQLGMVAEVGSDCIHVVCMETNDDGYFEEHELAPVTDEEVLAAVRRSLWKKAAEI